MNCRCTDCGYLTLRRLNSTELVPAEKDYRESGYIPASNGYYECDPAPHCYKGHSIGPFPNPNDVTSCHAVACKDRECPSFLSWSPGKNAKEHEQMTLQEQMDLREIKLRQQFEALYEIRHQETLRQSSKFFYINIVVSLLSAIGAAALTKFLN